MNVRLTLSKGEYESMLIDIINKAMNREVQPSEIKSVALNYNPEANSEMTVVLEIPPKDTTP